MNSESKEALQQRREDILVNKREIEKKMLAIRTLVRTGGFMPREKYKQCCDSQDKYITQVKSIENELGSIKLKLRRIADEEFDRKALGKVPPVEVPTKEDEAKPEVAAVGTIQELVALRAYYQEFSADHSRVASRRQMAAEFAVKLNPIIRKAIARPQPPDRTALP